MRAMMFFDDPGNSMRTSSLTRCASAAGRSKSCARRCIEIEAANEGVLFEEGSPSFLGLMIEWAHAGRLRSALPGPRRVPRHRIGPHDAGICSGITESARRFLIELRQSEAGPVLRRGQLLRESTRADGRRYAADLNGRGLPRGHVALRPGALAATHPVHRRDTCPGHPHRGGDSLANMGTGLFEMAVHPECDHDDENWHSPSSGGQCSSCWQP